MSAQLTKTIPNKSYSDLLNMVEIVIQLFKFIVPTSRPTNFLEINILQTNMFG